ncbi:MAG TPA: glycosyltransferase, partial [Chthoniobacteraceae bacterium]|nr:glycosyltransferase [Chthoniobacteraceae bacterium]
MSAPSISVLLPVFNAAPLLGDSVESVLDQTFGDFELLIVNDGSTDETAAILREIRDPRVRVLTNSSNRGLTRSLNRGLAEARGEFIARQDADDLCEPHRFERQIAFLRNLPQIPLLGTAGWRVNSSTRKTGSNDLPTTHEAILWASVTDNPFLHTSVMFRRAVIANEFGGYNEEFPICQDFELWSRIAARYQVANLVHRLVRMREHASSMTQT